MAITTVLFDLDGTLLPMDQELFIKTYLQRLGGYLANYGYEPKPFLDGLWKSIGAMMKNTSSKTNEVVFWESFCAIFGEKAREDEPLFDAFYRTDFQKVQEVCGFDPLAAVAVNRAKELGFRVVLATNPVFPAVATQSRIRWAGVDPADFEWITTYENSISAKPNPIYYNRLLEQLGLTAVECLMVGNDVEDDMIVRTLGMETFLLTNWLINEKNADTSVYPQGGYEELLAFLERVKSSKKEQNPS